MIQSGQKEIEDVFNVGCFELLIQSEKIGNGCCGETFKANMPLQGIEFG